MSESLWAGEWRGRLRENLSAAGFTSIHAFVLKRDGKTYEQMSSELLAVVSPAQLVIAHLEECLDKEIFIDGAAECLARALMTRLRHGWGQGLRSEYCAASAFSQWSASVSQVGRTRVDPVALKGVWRIFRDDIRPPSGWLPLNGQDEKIRHAFQLAGLSNHRTQAS